MDPGICRGCRLLLHPMYARRVPPPTNPLGLTRRFSARCQAYYYLGSHRTGATAGVMESPVPEPPYTPLQVLAQSEEPSAGPPSPDSTKLPSSCSPYYEGWDTPPPPPSRFADFFG